MVIPPLPWQPVPMADSSFMKKFFQSKLPLVPPEAICSCLVTCNLGEEIDPDQSTLSFQGAVESDKGPSSFLFSRLNIIWDGFIR